VLWARIKVLEAGGASLFSIAGEQSAKDMRETCPLRLVAVPGTRNVVRAPPVIVKTGSIDFTCPQCSVVLLQAAYGEIHDLVIQCRNCGSCSMAE
jgi:hypothetical protein